MMRAASLAYSGNGVAMMTRVGARSAWKCFKLLTGSISARTWNVALGNKLKATTICSLKLIWDERVINMTRIVLTRRPMAMTAMQRKTISQVSWKGFVTLLLQQCNLPLSSQISFRGRWIEVVARSNPKRTCRLIPRSPTFPCYRISIALHTLHWESKLQGIHSKNTW